MTPIYLALVHLRDAGCSQCNAPLAAAGSRSFIVDDDGSPHGFPRDAVPDEMSVEIRCQNGHTNRFFVPNELGAEETLHTPEDAPVARDAELVS